MAENAHYPHVFEPLRVGHVEMPNRLFFTPHGAGYVAPDPSAPGFWGPAPNTLDYYVERARGGIGLIIQGGTIVHPTSEYPALWQLFSERSAELWRPVVEGVQTHGTKMFVQLMRRPGTMAITTASTAARSRPRRSRRWRVPCSACPSRRCSCR